MKNLGEGELPENDQTVEVWYDEEDDVVQVQLDFLDINFYSGDFQKLVDILTNAKMNLEMGLGEEFSE
jgi:hypothetical protein